MEDKIIQQIQNLFAGVDDRDWQRVASTMHETVLLDYFSMTGNPAVRLAPKEITGAWATFLPGFDRTHHHLSDFSVQINGDQSQAHFEGKADHFINDQVWTVEGSYDTKLELVSNDWRIAEFKFNFARQSGNKNLPAMATKNMQVGRR